jgi:hypothetical protein
MAIWYIYVFFQFWYFVPKSIWQHWCPGGQGPSEGIANDFSPV